MKKSLLTLLAIVVSIQSFAINISGYINQNTTWTKANSPYIITGYTLIDSNATLTIEPGTVIKFDEYKVLYVDGMLNMKGTATDNIFVTTNAKYPRAVTSGFAVRNNKSTDTLRFEYCHFKYVGVGVSVENMASIVTNCLFEYCGTGIYNGKGSRSYTHVSNCRFNYCETAMFSDGYTVFTKNIVTKGKSYGLIINTWNVNNTCTNNVFYNSEKAITKCTHVSNNVVSYNKNYGISLCNYVSNNQIWNNGYGIINDWTAPVYLYQNSIEYNQTGIWGADTTHSIHGNCIAHNNVNMDRLRVIVNVSGNYWGETDSAKIAATINDYWDNFVDGEAKFMPFMQASDGSCASSLTIPDTTVYFPTGIDNVAQENDLKIFPNPAFNTLTIQSGNNNIKDICIYNLTGYTVIHQSANQREVKMDISSLPGGIYLYKISAGEDEIYTGKLLKE